MTAVQDSGARGVFAAASKQPAGSHALGEEALGLLPNP